MKGATFASNDHYKNAEPHENNSETEYFQFLDEYLEDKHHNYDDDPGSSATHTSMHDLETRAELCEYLAKDLHNTTPHRSNCTCPATSKSRPDGSLVSERFSSTGDSNSM